MVRKIVNIFNQGLPFLVVAFLLFIAIKRYVIEDNKLVNNHEFTEAKIFEITNGSEGSPVAEFQFTVKGKLYKSYYTEDNFNQIKIGEKYLLKYYPPDPNIARILLDKPIKDSFTLEYYLTNP